MTNSINTPVEVWLHGSYNQWVARDGRQYNMEECCLPHVFAKLSQFSRYGVEVIGVLDGKLPDLKQGEHVRRYGCSSRSTGNIHHYKSQLHQRVAQLFRLFSFPLINPEGEGEATCAVLEMNGIVDGVISKDGDAFLFGARRLFKDVSLSEKNTDLRQYRMNRIEKKNLFREHLIGLGCVSGCDYNSHKGIPDMGPVKAIKLLQPIPAGDVAQYLSDLGNEAKPLPLRTAAPSNKEGKKPPHCSQCGHLGTKASHKIKGCVSCGSCRCPWHLECYKNEPLLATLRLETSCRDKIVSQGCYGQNFSRVFSEFSKIRCPPSLDELDTCDVDPCGLIEFCVTHLRWSREKSQEKVSLVCARFNLQGQLSSFFGLHVLLSPSPILISLLCGYQDVRSSTI